MLARDVQALGIEAVFGLVSDDTAMFATALDAIGIRFHGARHENSAITMAEGYAAASGQLGVAVVGRGPATANGMHGAVYTSRTESPVLIIYGEAPVAGNALNAIGPDYKEFNTVGVLSAAGIQVFRATSASGARTALADAVAAAQLGSTVALLLPTNVQRSEIEVREDNELSSPTPSPRPLEKARSPVIDATVEILKKSRRPLIVAGFGAHRAGAREVLERLADKIGALLITSMGSGLQYNERNRKEESRIMGYVTNHLREGIDAETLSRVDSERAIEGPLLWAALKSKYFVFALVPGRDGSEQYLGGLTASPAPGEDQAAIAVTQALGNNGVLEQRIFMGPQERDLLTAFENDLVSREALFGKGGAAIRLERAEFGGEVFGQRTHEADLADRLYRREPDAIGGQDPRQRMDQHCAHAQCIGHTAGMLSARSAKTGERVSGDVMPARDADLADRIRHVVDRDG